MFELDTIINEFLIQKYIDGFTQLNYEHTLENNDVFSNFLIRNFCALLDDYETLIICRTRYSYICCQTR